MKSLAHWGLLSMKELYMEMTKSDLRAPFHGLISESAGVLWIIETHTPGLTIRLAVFRITDNETNNNILGKYTQSTGSGRF
jgi:hypothetical protein